MAESSHGSEPGNRKQEAVLLIGLGTFVENQLVQALMSLLINSHFYYSSLNFCHFWRQRV